MNAGNDNREALLVDSNDSERTYYAQRLRARLSDCVVLEARDGRSALDLQESHRIDCIVTELDLPDMSVFNLLLKIVPPASRPKVPFIVLDRVMRPDIAKMAKENGAQACLAKEFTSGDDLQKAILRAIAIVGPADKHNETKHSL